MEEQRGGQGQPKSALPLGEMRINLQPEKGNTVTIVNIEEFKFRAFSS